MNANTTYIGGLFTDFLGNKSNKIIQYLAAIDTTTGLINFDWNPNPNHQINTLFIDDNKLYAGGYFSSINEISGPTTIKNLASIDATTGTVNLDWHPNPNGRVESLAINSGTLFAGGRFTNFDSINNPNSVKHLAAIGLESGDVNTSWRPNPNNWVHVLALSANKLYIGGEFTNLDSNTGTIPIQNLAAIDIILGEVDINWLPNPNGGIYTLAMNNETLYAGGSFIGFKGNTGTNTIKNLAALTIVDGSVKINWNPNPIYPVYALALDKNTLYVGGEFSNLEGNSSTNQIQFLATIDATSGSVNSDWKPNPNYIVYDLIINKNTLYVSGAFTNFVINNSTKNFKYLAALDKVTGNLNFDWTPNPNYWVFALEMNFEDIYIGGSFTSLEISNNELNLNSAVDRFKVSPTF